MKRSAPSLLPFLTAFLSLIMLFSTACQKSEEEEATPDTGETEAPCMVLEETRKSHGGTFLQHTATVEYDAKGQIASATYTSILNPELVNKYERNPAGKISRIQTFYGDEVMWEMALEYDPQGKWTKATTASTAANGNATVLIEYEHDSQGNIIKSTTTLEDDSKTDTHIKTYEYTNGNLTGMFVETSVVYKQGSVGGSHAIHYEYEYYLDKPAFPLEYDDIYNPTLALATPSKNLVKRVTHTIPTEEDLRHVTDLTYKLNAEGMPVRTARTSIIYQHGTVKDLAADSLVVIRSYRCE
jgi:hypothetical protein